jgi:hypothetical protein
MALRPGMLVVCVPALHHYQVGARLVGAVQRRWREGLWRWRQEARSPTRAPVVPVVRPGRAYRTGPPTT